MCCHFIFIVASCLLPQLLFCLCREVLYYDDVTLPLSHSDLDILETKPPPQSIPGVVTFWLHWTTARMEYCELFAMVTALLSWSWLWLATTKATKYYCCHTCQGLQRRLQKAMLDYTGTHTTASMNGHSEPS